MTIQTQVVFTAVNALVLRDNKHSIKYDYPVLTNPRNMALDVPTQHWKMGKNNTIVEMTDEEKKVRDADIDRLGLNYDNDIFQPQKEQGQPVSKPFVIQEIKNTPILHIETKEIRHLDIKPIASFDVNPIKLEAIRVEPVKLFLNLEPLTIAPIQLVVPKTLEWLHIINTIIFLAMWLYVVLK